jgi:hypothetical protein
MQYKLGTYIPTDVYEPKVNETRSSDIIVAKEENSNSDT